MRIGIFVVMAGRQAGGPETYECSLIRALAELDSDNEYHIFCLGPEARDAIGVKQGNVHYHVMWPPIRWISLPISIPLSLRRQRVDFYHATFVPPPLSRLPYLFTMHDVTPLAYPHFYPPAIQKRLATLIRRGLQRARLILCVSQNALETTAEMLNVSPERMTVVYHGVDPLYRPIPTDEAHHRMRQTYGIDRPYVLFVGKLELRKNIQRLLEAYAMFRRQTAADVLLVLAGRRTYAPELIDQTLEKLGIREQVIELGYVAPSDMPSLYSGADVFLFATLWEGFGIPVLESMACATPVITSRVSCLPEIVGDAAILVDPTSVDQIAEAIGRLHRDPTLRQTLVERGLKRASQFTWQRCAQQTLAAYRQMAALASKP